MANGDDATPQQKRYANSVGIPPDDIMNKTRAQLSAAISKMVPAFEAFKACNNGKPPASGAQRAKLYKIANKIDPSIDIDELTSSEADEQLKEYFEANPDDPDYAPTKPQIDLLTR